MKICRRSPRGNVDWNNLMRLVLAKHCVVPHEGTWIEIACCHCLASACSSFPTRERGLKLNIINFCMSVYSRSPRGNVDWNFQRLGNVFCQIRSFPTRERGLKCSYRGTLPRSWVVVPHEGTWIEIFPVFRSRMPVICRSPRGNVDWNLRRNHIAGVRFVVPHEGTWIEIRSGAVEGSPEAVVPHEGTWIEI